MLHMLEGWVLVKPDEAPDKTQGGIVLANPLDETKKLKTGEIVRVGAARFLGYQRDGGRVDRIPVELVAGQHVVYNSYNADDWEDEGDKYAIMRHEDIIAIRE